MRILRICVTIYLFLAWNNYFILVEWIVGTTFDIFVVVGWEDSFYHCSLFGIDQIGFAPLKKSYIAHFSACNKPVFMKALLG